MSATESIAERAFCAIERRLKSIRTEDGFTTDAGLNVFRARRSLAASDLPGISVWDGGENPSDSQMSRDLIDLDIDIEIHVAVGQDCTGKILERGKADIKRAIRPNKSSNLFDDDGHIGTIRYGGAKPLPREDGSSSESITLKYIVSFVEIVGDPYRNQ